MDLLNEIQKNPNRNFFISASAGTGKTYTLTKYYISILENNYPDYDIVDRIVAVTFTNKAAGEMRERIMEAVYEKLEENPPKGTVYEEWYNYWNNIKINLSRAWIKTIDSFCSRILRDNNIQIGIDPNFGMVSEFKKDREIDKAIYYSLKIILELYEDREIEWLRSLSDKRKNNIKNNIELLKKEKDKFKKTLLVILNELKLDNFKDLIKEVIQKWRLEMVRVKVFEELELADTDLSNKYTDILWLFKIIANISKEYFESLTLDNFQFDFKGILEKTVEALDNKSIREKYKNRFKYIIVDEFQDTNYLQKEIFEKLHHEDNYLFYVGDRKQSIYRFRGADVSVFTTAKNEFQSKNYFYSSLNTNRRSEKEIVDFANELSSQVLFNTKNLNQENIDYKILEDADFQKDDFSYSEDSKDQIITPNITGEDDKRIKYINITPEANNNSERKKSEIQAMVKTVKNLVGKEMTFRKRVNGKIVREIRNIQPGDIAILLKQMSGYEEEIKQEFNKNKIPFYIIGGKSFYYKSEIQALFSALSAVQNPFNDFEFSRYMMSLIGGMTFIEYDKLTKLRKDKNSLFETFEENLDVFENSNNILIAYKVLKKYKDLKYFLKPTSILKGIVNETEYLLKLSVLDDSESAISNVKKLLSDAEKYNNIASSFSELVRLLKKSTDIDEEEAVLEDETSNSVKIMTIHKSKGLEFPIVIMGGLYKSQKKNKSSEVEFSLPNSEGENYYIINSIFEDILKETDDPFLKWFKNNDFLDQTENHRLMYVGVTRAKEMFLPLLVDTKNATYNDFFTKLNYNGIDQINEEDLQEIDMEIKDKTDRKTVMVQESNLKKFEHLAYKQYIAPTYLINETKPSESEYAEEQGQKVDKVKLDSLFSDQELLFRGSDLHAKLQSSYEFHHLENLVERELLPKKLIKNDMIKYAFSPENKVVKNEWRIVKNIEINNRDYMLFGIPDKVIIDNGKITILDYKYSGLYDEEKIKDYKFQISFYLYLLKDFGIPKEGYIVSIKNGKTVKFEYDQNIESKIFNKIKELN
ncbi:UvrD-helicase domain-containing protein [Geotoga petraea]|uniref:DNA 3'-5' helicase n=1 Tax=Geotoga petraea TaxID=28234 RepID=A0A1G6HPZ7_9BACT|nr:UvrD-helicase domain-containing protein [Geotoga petraea]SDB95566.1 ATP-dependent exoDNAse (exonuclease V) beta subunit (contains helicase and exonuclease domains) [Geotoga petraea]